MKKLQLLSSFCRTMLHPDYSAIVVYRDIVRILKREIAGLTCHLCFNSILANKNWCFAEYTTETTMQSGLSSQWPTILRHWTQHHWTDLSKIVTFMRCTGIPFVCVSPMGPNIMNINDCNTWELLASRYSNIYWYL